MLATDIELAKLIVDPQNARKHSDRNISDIAASLHRFGQQTPIVIDSDNVVLKGNGQVQAALSLGWVTIKAVRTSLTDQEATAYAIADNRTAEHAEWDMEQLTESLGSLDDIVGTGFTSEEFDQLLESIDARPTIAMIEDEPIESLTVEIGEVKPTERKAEAKYPLAIVLTREEKNAWDRIKENRSDKATLLELIGYD